MVSPTGKNPRNPKSRDKNTVKISQTYQISSPANTIEYKLSNEDYVQLGWTRKPTVQLARRITLYETEVSKPQRWHEGIFEKFYDGGTLFFISDDSTSRVYYPNGKVAVKIDRPADKNYDLYTVFGPGGGNIFEADKTPRLIATFDTLGNGLVLDESGRTRLSYNQIGGICVDNHGAALPLVWTWSCRKSVPIMETIYTETSAVRLLEILRVAVNAPKSLPGEKMTKVMPSADKKCFTGVNKSIISTGSGTNDCLRPVKTICLKLNDFISLRILDRKNISLRFLCGTKTARFELGFNLNLWRPISSCLKDISKDRHGYVKSRVQDQLEPVKSNSSLFEILQEYRKNEQASRNTVKLSEKVEKF